MSGGIWSQVRTSQNIGGHLGPAGVSGGIWEQLGVSESSWGIWEPLKSHADAMGKTDSKLLPPLSLHIIQLMKLLIFARVLQVICCVS